MIATRIGQVEPGDHMPTSVTVGVDRTLIFLLPLWRPIWHHETKGPGEGEWQPMLSGMIPKGYDQDNLPPNWREMVMLPAGESIAQLIELLTKANEEAKKQAEEDA